jgi:hypothetical protein
MEQTKGHAFKAEWSRRVHLSALDELAESFQPQNISCLLQVYDGFGDAAEV